MAIVYCNDGGSNTSPYDTLAKAATAFLTAVDFASAGDDIYIGMDHAEAPGADTTYAFPGADGTPNRVISINTTTEAYDKADNVQIDNAVSTTDITISGHVKFYGVSMKIGDDFLLSLTDSHILLDDCIIELTGVNSHFSVGAANTDNLIRLKNTDVNFSGGGTTAGFFIASVGKFFWEGGLLSWTGTQSNGLIFNFFRSAHISIAGVDLSACTSALVSVSSSKEAFVEFHHCLLNSGVALTNGTISNAASRVLMSGCDDTTGNDLYRFEYVDYYGSIVHDDAIFVTTGGASDGTTPISWKMVTTANAKEFSEPLISPPIVVWVDSTGSKTFTVQCVWDSATNMQDDEMWPEIEFLEAAADTDSAFADGGLANILASPADISDQTGVTWTGTGGFTNENKFALAVTATINRVGPVLLRVKLAKPSTTAYADPLVTVT